MNKLTKIKNYFVICSATILVTFLILIGIKIHQVNQQFQTAFVQYEKTLETYQNLQKRTILHLNKRRDREESHNMKRESITADHSSGVPSEFFVIVILLGIAIATTTIIYKLHYL